MKKTPKKLVLNRETLAQQTQKLAGGYYRTFTCTVCVVRRNGVWLRRRRIRRQLNSNTRPDPICGSPRRPAKDRAARASSGCYAIPLSNPVMEPRQEP